jgi:tRNA nucleotidyltransferase (CCA-adding enzyme)
MRKYLVGGAVRDLIMNKVPNDYDYVLVGATESDIENILLNGGKQVGKDFPVFLIDGEEHALARTERAKGSSSERKYTDFDVQTTGVSLEDDLGRRDFTMNAIASSDGAYIDPFGGIQDIHNRVIKHIHSEPFMEDPLRILRAARFAAYLDFNIHPDTLLLMQSMVADNMLANLTSERVWKETVKAMNSVNPVAYFKLLDSVGALVVVFPELAQLKGVPQPAEHHPEICSLEHTFMVLEKAVSLGCGLNGRFAALFHDLGKGITAPANWPQHIDHESSGLPLLSKVQNRLNIPNDTFALAATVMQFHLKVHRALDIARPGKLVTLIRDLGGLKNDSGSFFNEVLTACKADAQGRLGFSERSYPQADFLKEVRQNMLEVRNSAEYADMIANGITGKEFGEKLNILRIKAAQKAMHDFKIVQPNEKDVCRPKMC